MLDDEEMNAVFTEYDPDNKYKLKDLYQHLNELIKQNKNKNFINNSKGSFTRALGLAIQNKITEKVNKQTGATEFSKIKEEIKKNTKEYYQKRKLKTELATQLKITQIEHADIAEIAASKELHDTIIDIWLDRVNGKETNLKADISFVVGFSPKQGKTKLPIHDLNNILNEELKNFLPDYRDITGGVTDTLASSNVLADKMTKIIKQIEEKLKITDKNRAEVEQLLNELYDAIYGSISVKDYELYSNNLGFHGGSLGGGGTPESVITNVINMYKSAGIDAIDANDILFAVLNSTNSTYGNNAMQTHVANYLLGGAALMMFDEDFNTAQKFIEQTESTLFSNNHIRSVQLYKLNSVYVPASYILYTIWEQLVPIYQDIVLNFNNFPKTNHVVITTHNLTSEDIPIGDGYDLAINRWNYISELGIKNTKIQFMFMAGMLDIFKNLGEAFKIELP